MVVLLAATVGIRTRDHLAGMADSTPRLDLSHFLGFRIKFGFATKLQIDPALLSQHGAIWRSR